MGDSDLFLIISLLTSFSIFVLILLLYCIIRSCTRNDYHSNGYQSLNQSSITDHFMGSHSNDIPKEFLNDQENLLALEFDFTDLSPEEQQQYLKGQEFQVNYPLDFSKVKGKTFTPEDEKLIKDFGINAFKFEDDNDAGNPSYIIADKTEINFMNNDLPYNTKTASLNYPLPVKNRSYSDIIYWETKVFEYIPSTTNSHFAIGLITKPYPTDFRLPGYNKFSISYESTGNLKINKPFPTPCQQHLDEQSQFNALVLPPLQQSDVVGFGYVMTTGTIFITRNGKKILDVLKGCFIDLYPAVGCFSTNAKFQVNIGQLGFVWIEANVRKYGFVSTSDYKKLNGDRGLASLPQYNKLIEGSNNDKILDKGEELPPRYNTEEELDFFGRSSTEPRVGSSNQHMKADEKLENSEEFLNDKPQGGSSEITNDTEEVMDMRERIYELNVQNSNEIENSIKEDEEGINEHGDSLIPEQSIGSSSSETNNSESNQIHNDVNPNADFAGTRDNDQSSKNFDAANPESPSEAVHNQTPQKDSTTLIEEPDVEVNNENPQTHSSQLQSSEESSATPEVESEVIPSNPNTNPNQSKKKKKKSGKKSSKKKSKRK